MPAADFFYGLQNFLSYNLIRLYHLRYCTVYTVQCTHCLSTRDVPDLVFLTEYQVHFPDIRPILSTNLGGRESSVRRRR